MSETTEIIVTKEEFKKYCEIEKSGVFNMLSPQARQMVGLPQEKYFYILKNYEELEKLHS